MAIALGAARLLSRLQDRLAGEIRFLFQPAEEMPKDAKSGAPGMVAAGVLDNPPVAAVVGLHVAPNVETGHVRYHREEVMAGADHLTLTVIGKSAHGATPHRGVDPILVSAQALNLIQGFLAQRLDARHPVVLTFGTISGGSRFNILADKVVLEGSLRYLQEGVRREVVAGLRRKFTGLGQATGARIELEARPIYPVLKNDPRLTEQAVAVLHRVLGPERLKSHFPAMGSEDFSYFAAQVPAFYFFLGVRPPGRKPLALHSPHFNPDEAALLWGLKAAAGLLVCLSEPEFPF
jgi:amidohydrolase